jgi:hypothetical protein
MMQQASIEILWFIQVCGGIFRNFCLKSFALKSIFGQLEPVLVILRVPFRASDRQIELGKLENLWNDLNQNFFLLSSSRLLPIKKIFFDSAKFHLWNFGHQSG